jgi:hypothetical protein
MAKKKGKKGGCRMSAVLLSSFLLFLVSCGDDSTSNTTQEPGSNPVSFLCSHEGDLWLCPDGGDGACVRDQSEANTTNASESESERVVYPIFDQEGAQAFAVKLSSGAITIIAECGSSVNFSNSEETSDDDEANVTTTTANFGYNTGAEPTE